ncbi:MAG TPA: hypothetical protein VKX28_02865 [Xanthobacteraceae bacterium]|nr:hypothetical protein [Xanthobacteraceae bacterium]
MGSTALAFCSMLALATLYADPAAARPRPQGPATSATPAAALSTKAALRWRALGFKSRYEIKTLLAKGKLPIPLLSVAGEKSFGQNQKALVETFASNAAFVIIQRAGHFVPEERPRDWSM